MKMGSFLLGGMVGAAAVVYLNTKNKAMLLSAFSGNNSSVGNTMSKAKEKLTSAFDSEKWKGEGDGASASTNQANSTKSGNSPSNYKDANSRKSDYDKVEEIIKDEPKLKATVEEILSENKNKEMYPTQ